MTCQRCHGLMHLAKWWDDISRVDVWMCAGIRLIGGFLRTGSNSADGSGERIMAGLAFII